LIKELIGFKVGSEYITIGLTEATRVEPFSEGFDPGEHESEFGAVGGGISNAGLWLWCCGGEGGEVSQRTSISTVATAEAETKESF